MFAMSILKKEVTGAQLRRYAKLIYDQTGIRISDQKKSLLSNRLRRRLRALDMDCYDAYYRHLKTLPTNSPEWDAFLQEITTHETYLFRDTNQWDWFHDEYLPELQSEARQNGRIKSLRIWSAACSTGDEAYTIAALIADKLVNHTEWNIRILGTDIGIGALESARAAIFGLRAMKRVPDGYRRRFFSKMTEDKTWTPKPTLTKWTQFRQHNLLDAMQGGPFDVVFLKNVLIYFDTDSKKRVVDHLFRALKPGGLLVTGPAEGVSDLLGDFERQNGWLHCRPAVRRLKKVAQ